MSLSLQAALGLAVFCGLAMLCSENRRRLPVREVVAGIGLQIVLAVLLLHLEPARKLVNSVNRLVAGLQDATEAGTTFVFGYLGGGLPPFEMSEGSSTLVLAFQILPLILVVSALTAVLTYWKVLPIVVRGFSRLLQKPFGIGGAVGLGTAANIFVGMVEAPLFVRHYLATMSRSGLFVVMCSGMATIAGTVLFIYATLIETVIEGAAGHLVVASVISAPAAVMIARIMVPGEREDAGDALTPPRYASTMDAVTQGTQSGLALYLNVVAMLLVLVALVKLVNIGLGILPDFHGEPLSLQRVLGFLMSPLAWLMGIPWDQSAVAGALLGTKTVLNEFLAYIDLAQVPPDQLSPRSRLIMTYALCGFANFGSLGILIGGLTTMAPERRAEIVDLGLRSIVGGTLATCCTGSVVALIGA
ncbi:MAG: nucleoside transporter C-terminal domain-containing protein [Gammaproteobacteria bacterium]|jgi:CNT family concentrative nucleoside transporter|nr:MAG: nucleoside:proton symporter [Gammaproteobacteria bacterium SG8_31]